MNAARRELDRAVTYLCEAIRDGDVPAIDYWQQLIQILESTR